MVTESKKDLKLLSRSEWAIIVLCASVRECEKSVMRIPGIPWSPARWRTTSEAGDQERD